MTLILPSIQRWASLVAQLVKKLPAERETWVLSLVREDSPGEANGYPLQYSCLENPMDKRHQSMGMQRVGHNSVTNNTPNFITTPKAKRTFIYLNYCFFYSKGSRASRGF